MNLATLVSTRRHKLGLTQAELALRCECTVGAISAIERGRVLPREARVVLGLSKLLRMKPGAVLELIAADEAGRDSSRAHA